MFIVHLILWLISGIFPTRVVIQERQKCWNPVLRGLSGLHPHGIPSNSNRGHRQINRYLLFNNFSIDFPNPPKRNGTLISRLEHDLLWRPPPHPSWRRPDDSAHGPSIPHPLFHFILWTWGRLGCCHVVSRLIGPLCLLHVRKVRIYTYVVWV